MALPTWGQTYTFKCVTDPATQDVLPDSCEGCAVWEIDSRSFNGLLIYEDLVPWRWIEMPYTLKVRGDTIDIWEHTSPPSRIGRNMFFPDRESILLGQTPFATMPEFLDSAWCPFGAAIFPGLDTLPLFYVSDSIDLAPVYRGDTLLIVGRNDANVTFDSINKKYIIDVVSGGGGGVDELNGLTGIVDIVGDGINIVTQFGQTITVTGTEIDGLVTNEGALSVTAGTGTTSVIHSNTSGSTDVTINAGTGLSISENPGTGNITLTNTGDLSATNELQTLANTSDATSHTATLSDLGGSIKAVEGAGIGLATTGTSLDGIVTITNTAPDQTVSITGAGISVVTGTYPTFTITSTEVDGLITNEGLLGVGAGGAASSVLLSNTSTAAGVTINAAGILSISETTSANGGQITLTATEGFLGTVTSVGLSMPTIFSVSGSPVTGSGTLTATLNTQTANTVFSGPASGGAATPTFRALVLADILGLNTANNGLSDNEAGGGIFRLGNRYMNGSDGLFSFDRKVNLNGFSLFIGDNTDSTLLHVNGNTDRVGIHTTAPGRTFSVNGEVEIKDLTTTNPTVLLAADANGVLSETFLGTGLSFTGTTLNATGGGTNYQTWRDDGAAATVRPNANFVSTATVAMTLTDDAINTETEVTANVVDLSITTAKLANLAVTTGKIADQAVTYVKLQNAVSDNVLLGNNNGANTSYEEINPAAAQTMLGYIDGAGANQRIAYFTDANTLAAEAAFLYDAGNDRMTITAALPGLGAGAAILNLTNTGPDGTGEFLQMRGDITGNMLAGMTNINTGAGANAINYISQAGNTTAGDPVLQFNITGSGGTSAAMGIDNSDVNKFKITPNGTLPGINANASFVATNDAIPLWGIDTDAPGRMLDVAGDVRAKNLVNTNAPPTASNIGAGLGTGGSVDAVTGGNNAFTVSFTIGTAPVLDGPLFRLTFANPFTITSNVVWSCQRDPDTLDECSKFAQTGTGPGFIDFKAHGTLTASKNHILVVHVIGQ